MSLGAGIAIGAGAFLFAAGASAFWDQTVMRHRPFGAASMAVGALMLVAGLRGLV